MTTPEKFRRRQRIEGTALLILGVFTILITLYFRDQDIDQRQCLSENFAQFTAVSKIRGDAIEEVIGRIAEAKTSEEVRDALADFRRSRKVNPIPPFPEGTCD